MYRVAPNSIVVILIASVAVCAEPIDFDRDIKPILSENCYHCHGPDEGAREADLRLDTRAGLFGRGEAAIVVAGEAESSELIRRVTSPDADLRMPPADSNRSLTAEQVQQLVTWVKTGAKWRGHWSLEPIVKPSVPADNAIDYFVTRQLAAGGLSQSTEAAKERLLRRVTLDLTGLPPTIDEIDALLADHSERAYERVVDRLLASAHYGERMAWPWLDAARYADSNGFQGDNERTMWPWRDWVVRAINENMPYDQFTIWQLAGDLLPDATLEQQLATGFCRNHMINGEGGRIPEENRVEYVFDQLETMGTVWLGLTLQCCRCHDHKFDPIERREYYQLFAFFNQTPVDGSGRNPKTPPIITYSTSAQQQLLEQLRDSLDNAQQQVAAAESALSDRLSKYVAQGTERSQLQAILKQPLPKRSNEQLAKLREFARQHAPAYGKLLKQHAEFRQRHDKLREAFPRVMVMQDMAQPRETFMLNKGLYNQRQDKVTAQTPRALPPLVGNGPYNRLTLAKWLIDSQNPLTARVTVNRHWQIFFGAGLVTSPEDFGQQGQRPSHPDLLDWLAGDLVENGWDMKRLHKTIVMSATYRQSAKASADLIARDPDNRSLSRGPRFRMPSWMIRDHALAVSGLLQPQLGGPPVHPYQPPGVWAEATFGKKKYVQGTGAQLYRRSLYSFWRRIIGPTMFFDTGKRQVCSVRVTRTNTPLHALTTMNDVTYVEAARALAQRIMPGRSSPQARLAHAFRLATSRAPSKAELTILTDRYEALRQQFADAPEQAKQLLSVGQSPRDESLDPLEHAAYAVVCSLILNLDEALTK